MNQLHRLLQNLDFTTNEVIVYEHLLKNGARKAVQISKHCSISRTNTYNVLRSLEEKGVLRRLEESKISRFAVEHPHALQEHLTAKKSSLDSSQSELTQCMDRLVASYGLTESNAGVFRFEGLDGLKRVYENLLQDGHSIDIIMDRPRLRDFLGDYNEKFVGLRRRKKIKTRIITPDYRRIESDDQTDLREVRYLKKSSFPFEMDLKITSEKLVMTTLKEGVAIGITIADREIARNFLLLFEFLWHNAAKK